MDKKRNTYENILSQKEKRPRTQEQCASPIPHAPSVLNAGQPSVLRQPYYSQMMHMDANQHAWGMSQIHQEIYVNNIMIIVVTMAEGTFLWTEGIIIKLPVIWELLSFPYHCEKCGWNISADSYGSKLITSYYLQVV